MWDILSTDVMDPRTRPELMEQCNAVEVNGLNYAAVETVTLVVFLFGLGFVGRSCFGLTFVTHKQEK